MKLAQNKPLTEDELMAGLILVDPYLFKMFFFDDEFKLPPSREQRLMMVDQSERILFCTGRKLSKTVQLEALVLQDGILNVPHENGVDEALFVTPGEAHMKPFLDRLISRIERTPVLKMFLLERPARGEFPTIKFATGLTYHFRIEGFGGSDRNMVGLRAKYVRGDELALGSWVNHNSRLQTALPGAKWMYAGVPNGVRSTPFYSLDQTGLGASWSRHNWPTYINPIYQGDIQKSQESLIESYGGEETHGYITQVLGRWGEEMRSSFPPEMLAVHAFPYFYKRLAKVDPNDRLEDPNAIALMLGISSTRCDRFAFGWDYGYSPDPSILTGAFSRNGEDTWYQHFMLEMIRVPLPIQIQVVMYCVEHIFSGIFSGLSSDSVQAIQTLQGRDVKRPELYYLAEPGGVISVPVKIKSEVEGSYDVAEQGDDNASLVSVRRKEFYTVTLRQYMTTARLGMNGRKLWLGQDTRTIDELIGTTERRTAGGYTMYYGLSDPERKNGMMDHRVDSLRFLSHAIYVGSQGSGEVADNDELADAMGWAGATTTTTWTPFWGRG